MALRIGIGYDSHRFEAGRPLVLAGVAIPHEAGLAGHSDADVAAHALIDAILGAAGLGDLGAHFPPGDERWRDADSIDLLRIALAQVRGIVANADVSIVCESPAIGPHRPEMERVLGEVLSAPVNVKATTNEGMGWIGRNEGIAAIAVALVDVD